MMLPAPGSSLTECHARKSAAAIPYSHCDQLQEEDIDATGEKHQRNEERQLERMSVHVGFRRQVMASARDEQLSSTTHSLVS